MRVRGGTLTADRPWKASRIGWRQALMDPFWKTDSWYENVNDVKCTSYCMYI